MEDRVEVCSLSRQMMFQSVFTPLQGDLRFFHIPLPAASTACFTATCRNRQRYGLTLFRMDFRTGRAPRFRRRHHIHEGLSVRAPAWPRTFWFKPVSIFGLATMTTFI